MKKKRKLKPRKSEVRNPTYKVIRSDNDWLVCLGKWEGTKERNWNWTPISVHESEANAEKEIRRINEEVPVEEDGGIY